MVPTPPGPVRYDGKYPVVALLVRRVCRGRCGASFRIGERAVLDVSLVLVRTRSRDVDGVSRSEKLLLFRRAGGKYPSALRGNRAICVGLELPGNNTQESCCQGGSVSALEAAAEDVVKVEVEFVRVLPCFEVVGRLARVS